MSRIHAYGVLSIAGGDAAMGDCKEPDPKEKLTREIEKEVTLPLLGSSFSSPLVESSESLPATTDTAALSPPAMERSERREGQRRVGEEKETEGSLALAPESVL